MQRQEGYYWVKVKNWPKECIAEWQNHEHNGGEWYICGREEAKYEDEVEYVGQRIPSNEGLATMQKEIESLRLKLTNCESALH